MKWVTRERPKIDRIAGPCRSLGGERHGWRPRAILKEMGT